MNGGEGDIDLEDLLATRLEGAIASVAVVERLASVNNHAVRRVGARPATIADGKRLAVRNDFRFARAIKRKRRQEAPLDDYSETLAFPSPESASLFDTVMALPETYRSVIHLFYYEDYTVAEIAKLLHLSQSNVKTRLSRGRNLLKETLKEDWNDDE